MTLVLEYIWALPVAIGVGFVFYFAMQDLGHNAGADQSQSKTEDE